MFNSVRVRLTSWYVLVFGLLLAGFSTFVYLILSQTLYARLDQSLLNSVNILVTEFHSELAESEGDAAAAASKGLSEIRMSGVYLGLFDGEQLLSSSFEGQPQLTIPKELLAAAPARGQSIFRTLDNYEEEGARVVMISTPTKDKVYLAVAAEPLHDLVEQLESIREIFYLGFPLSLLVAGFGGFILAKKSLAPVVAMSNQAERISAQNLHERLSVKNKQDELGHLAGIFNDLLSRLNRSFEGMREFMADASHELRTPLSIIRGEADVALSQDRDVAEYRDALATIQDEAKRLSRIVDDMMALARADAGQRPLQIEELYLNDLVEECCRAARVLALHEGVSLSLEPAPDIAYRGDEDLLRRMLLNLLDNAAKYTPSGGSISVRIILESGKVSIVVSDTGIGIPAEAAARVFERFYRVDKARSRADGGSGLGLAIAKWVAEAHQGSIELTSRPGQGSTFIVSLPR